MAQTYVDVDRLLEAVDRSGADAVHPGYGFLSENARFAGALAERGVAFIGPRPEHLAQFGLKHEARRLAEAAGVGLLPGSGVLAHVEDALIRAQDVGYPVMLKSSAGAATSGCDGPRRIRCWWSSARTSSTLGCGCVCMR